MTPPHDPAASQLSVRGLFLSFSALLIPTGAVFTLPPEWADLSGPLWFFALVPTLYLASRKGWEGAAVALGVSIAVILLVHVGAGAMGRSAPDTLAWVLPLFLITGVSVGWLAEHLQGEAQVPTDAHLTDPVTGLPAETQVRLLLQNEFWAAERGRPVAVVLFELDDLSDYRSREGDAAAGQALAAFGEILTSTTRRMNLSGRLRLTRFLSILDGSDDEGAIRFAERVREAFHRTRLDGGPLSVSAGIAAYHSSMTHPDDLLAAAELALQRAHEAGGDCSRLFGRPASAATSLPTGQRSHPSALDVRGSEDPAASGDGSTLEGTGRRVLLVEEETSVRTLIATHLQKLGFQVEEAQDAVEGGKSLAQEFDVVICDLRLPGLPGHDLVSTVKARWPATPVVVVTGFRDARLTAEALSSGADRYLFKPFGMAELETHLRELLDRRERVRSERQARRSTTIDEDRARETRMAILDGARTLARAVEIMDPYTRGHSHRVASYSLSLLASLGDRAQGIEEAGLRVACELHDVGKIAIPESILNKDAPLTDDEYGEVREHPRVSRRILEPLIDDELVLAVASWHHERWDGKGYPDHLAGEAIPLPARIVAVADSLDAMTSPRAHRAGLEWEDAVEQIRARTGTQFDPGLLEAFEQALPQIHEIYQRDFPDGPTRHVPDLPAAGSVDGHARNAETASG